MSLFHRLTSFLFPAPPDPAVVSLYAACVTQARQPFFYTDHGVPDTVDGRFDLLLLHVHLVMLRLDAGRRQKLFDLMFADMERNLREMGVSDMRIGKRMRALIESFYGRSQAYGAAVDATALQAVLSRNLYGVEASPHAPFMAAYMVRLRQALADQDLENGGVVWI